MVGEDERRWARAREPSEATRNASSSRSCSRRATFPQGGPGGGADAHGAAAAAVSGMRLGRVPLGPDPTPSSTPLRPVKPVFKPIFAEGGRVIDPSSTPLEWRLSLCSSQFSARAADSLLGSKESRVGGWGLTAHPAPQGGRGPSPTPTGPAPLLLAYACAERPSVATKPNPLLDPPAPREPSVQADLRQGGSSFLDPPAPREASVQADLRQGGSSFDPLSTPLEWPRSLCSSRFSADLGRFPFRVERDACWL